MDNPLLDNDKNVIRKVSVNEPIIVGEKEMKAYHVWLESDSDKPFPFRHTLESAARAYGVTPETIVGEGNVSHEGIDNIATGLLST